MNKKAVFLDRDGTINVDKGYVYKIEDFEFLPGTLDALKIIRDCGFLIIIITNQSGIARGYYSKKQYCKLNDWMVKMLRSKGIVVDSYFCPHFPQGSVKKYAIECDCRKPHTGLFYKAIAEHNIDVKGSFAIGDKTRDLSICESTEIQGILLGKQGETEEKSTIIKKASLLDAVLYIREIMV